MNGYQDTATLADECEKQYRALKDHREEQKRHYDKLLRAKNNALTEEEYQNLAQQFREMAGYKDTAELADECEWQYRKIKVRIAFFGAFFGAIFGVIVGVIRAFNKASDKK
jgi:hypothetical protein